MPATAQNVKMWAGDSLVLRFPVHNADGSAPNLSGSSATWELGQTVYSVGTGVLITKTIGSGITMTLETDAGVANIPVFYVTLVPGDTAALPPMGDVGASYYHELRVTDASGNVNRVSLGGFTIEPTLIH